MIKRLASLSEMQGSSSKRIIKQINEIASRSGVLQQYTTYSRIWEYPWVWLQLELMKGRSLRLLDVGSERSPFLWFLATQGFDVTISDITANYWRVWRRASRQLKIAVGKRILDAQNLDLPTASVDVYLSVSVIEHIPDKAKVIAEATRVLRPGGLLVMTFDICEPDMGMTFPEWNGSAPTMAEFDNLFRNSPWFESGLAEVPWNTDDILDYLSWHRTTAPHHNYITGAAVVKRNDRVWIEPAWKDLLRNLRGKIHTTCSIAIWYLQHSVRVARRLIPAPINKPLRALRAMLQRLTMPPVESLPNVPDLFRVYRYLYQHPDIERRPGGWLYRDRFYPDYLTVGGASHAIFREALKFCQGQGVDVGAGLWPLPGAVPVDVWRGPGTGKSISDFENGSLDYVFSSHCLEHIDKWREVLAEWVKKLKPGGVIFLYLPHPDCAIWHPGSPFVGDGHKWIPRPEVIKQTLVELVCEIIQFDDGPDAMQSFYICARKLDGGKS